MEIKQYIWDVVDSNSWLLIEGKRGLLFDTVESLELFNVILELDQVTIILTHSHFDHIIGLNSIRSMRPDISVIATNECSINIGNRIRNMSSSATVFMSFYNDSNCIIQPFVCAPAETTFGEKYIFNWEGHEIKLSAVYGHSHDGLIGVIDDIMFSGDTLLNIPTITRLPGGSTKKFWNEDIPLLRGMDVSLVYPGHGKPGKKEEMIKVNKMLESYL